MLNSLFEGRRIAIVAAHPDDETIGAGALLSLLRETVFIHVTDGAPRDMEDATANGFSTREDYAAARRQEFHNALRAGNVSPSATLCLGHTDQEAALHLVEIARDLSCLLRQFAVDTVLVHPYEGGHPDHDSTAFAVHAACRLSAGRALRIMEFTSYHDREGRFETGAFLADHGTAEFTMRLDGEEQARKQRMFECFRTQHKVLRQFKIAEERFRRAPAYDFTSPPHRGRLWYEQFSWGITKSRWLALAKSAAEELSLC
jgi:N-acetylglucosamine malate deacetylase 2